MQRRRGRGSGFVRDLDRPAVVAGTQDEGMDRVDDRGEVRDDVAVGEREDGVQVHGGAQFRHARDNDLFGGTVVEQRRGDLSDRLARGALAHPHEHDAVADRHDVAAFDGCPAPVPLGIAPPDRGADEVGVEGVDRLVQQGLVVPGRPVQRVERHPAVDPARGVSRVEGVGQRWQQVVTLSGGLPGQSHVRRAVLVGQVVGGQAADEELREPPRLERIEKSPWSDRRDRCRPRSGR